MQAGAARCSHSSPLAEGGYLSFQLEEVTKSSLSSVRMQAQSTTNAPSQERAHRPSPPLTCKHCLKIKARLAALQAACQEQNPTSSCSPAGHNHESPECCWLPVDPAMLHSPALASQGRLGYLRAGRPSFPPAGMCFWVQKASGKAKPPQLCYLVLWLQLFAKKVSFFLLLIINGACFQARISR